MRTIITIICLLLSANAFANACPGISGMGGCYDKSWMQEDSRQQELIRSLDRINKSIQQQNNNLYWE